MYQGPPPPQGVNPAPPTGYSFHAPPSGCTAVASSMSVPPPKPAQQSLSISNENNGTMDTNNNSALVNATSPTYSRVPYPPPLQIVYPSNTAPPGILTNVSHAPPVSGPQVRNINKFLQMK